MLAVVILGCSVAPAIGQGVTAGYTLYVNFFYPFHFLYNLRATIRDQSGRRLGSALSVDGSMIVVPLRTETPTTSLSVTVSGYASDPLTYYEANPSFWPIFGQSTIPVYLSGGDFWITVALHQ
jgi:hypothetical protein